MPKIFVNETEINLISPNFTENDPTNHERLDPFRFKILCEEILNNNNESKRNEFTFLIHDLPVEKILEPQFQLIKAGGGVVFNEDSILWIQRLGKWDLPKGKIEKFENIEDGAVREVKEECGIENISLVRHLSDTYHVYKHKNNLILKKTYWYLMKSTDTNGIKPQLEEGITEVCWIKKDHMEEQLENTYPNIDLLMNELLSYTKSNFDD